MNTILKSIDDPEIIASSTLNMVNLFAKFTTSPQMKVINTPNVVYSESSLPVTLFNFNMRVNMTPEAVESHIADRKAYAHKSGHTTFFRIDPQTKPDDLADRLTAHGFTFAETVPSMAVNLDALENIPASPDGVTFHLAEDKATIRQLTRVMLEAFKVPETHTLALLTDMATYFASSEQNIARNYYAMLDHEMVATVLLFLDSGVVGIYNVATLPHARGKGIAGALTAYALEAASREFGYNVAILQASEMGYSLYKRMGFVDVCKFYDYDYIPKS